jgi:LPXTG-motif cell wall-anchored protein
MHFLKLGQSIFAATLFVAVLASPAAAKEKPWNKGSVATPAPIAGMGLVGIGMAGAALYLVIRRRRKPDHD